MTPMDGNGCLTIGNHEKGYLIYTQNGDFSTHVVSGKYHVYRIDKRDGTITLVKKSLSMKETFSYQNAGENQVIWLRKL
jgi:hypothetical protein